jgi:hypothetical protein
MKANIPTSYFNLPKKEKEAIDNQIKKFINDQVNHEEAELQKIWLQMACIVLHENFGFGKDRLTIFLGNWKRMYRRNLKLGNYEAQTEFLKEQMEKIFGKGGYPYEWIDRLENL